MLLPQINPSLPGPQVSIADPVQWPSFEGLAGATGQKVDSTINYMREFLNRPLQIPLLARLANISASHFFAVFKKRTGFAPKDFFIRLRIQRACDILDSSALSIKEVSDAVGYEDPFYFSRVFKSVCSM